MSTTAANPDTASTTGSCDFKSIAFKVNILPFSLNIDGNIGPKGADFNARLYLKIDFAEMRMIPFIDFGDPLIVNLAITSADLSKGGVHENIDSEVAGGFVNYSIKDKDLVVTFEITPRFGRRDQAPWRVLDLVLVRVPDL
ncbi:hypothetical protein AX16_006608 [Volvariella volvacea WC 439]|nr:hypothetical protein AX16_006608 [Volvariella volvacea WC 439]